MGVYVEIYTNIYKYMVPPLPGTYVWMEIVASAVETNLFQWLFGGYIFVVIRRVHFCGYSEGSFSERLYYHCPIEVQSPD